MTALFKFKKDNSQIVSGYSVEDIRSNRPVVVKEKSVVVGDIYAPQVLVQGMIYGYVVAVGVVVDQGGQVWGDICATEVDMRPGSKVHGWVSSMDAGTADLVRLGQVTIDEIPRSGEYAITDDMLRALQKLVPDMKTDSKFNKSRIEILRQLQTEAAAAISARVEIEKTIIPQANAMMGVDEKHHQSEKSDSVRDEETATIDGSKNADSEVALELADAENEINQLRKQLAALLDREMDVRNQLRWTKLSLERARQRQFEVAKEPNQVGSSLVDQARGRHLAKLLATVVERDLMIQELKDKIANREEQLFKLRTLTTKRIEKLESKLSKAGHG